MFPDRRIVCGYNIACAFFKTLMASSIGPKAWEHAFRMVVGAFHGHTHNRGCQVNWHPLYVDVGHSNFEGCECIFRKSNFVAPTTRHSSKFHRHQAIEEHMQFWDEDKYAALCLSVLCVAFSLLTTILQQPTCGTTIMRP